jgi:MIP family channel proteins
MDTVLARKVGAELIGTFGLVTAGCGAIIVSNTHAGALPSIGVALVFGIVIAVMVAATAHISGGHLNPAVSVGLAVTGRLPWRDLPFYLLAQFVGAILASLLLLWVFSSQAVLAQTANAPAAHVGTWQAVGVEIVATAFLVFVISATATDTQGIGKLAPFAIGATILLGALWAGPISGASMNPARSLGPALVSGDWDNLRTFYWIYLVAPIIGGIIGAVLYQFIRQPATEITIVEAVSAPVASPSPKKQRTGGRR